METGEAIQHGNEQEIIALLEKTKATLLQTEALIDTETNSKRIPSLSERELLREVVDNCKVIAAKYRAMHVLRSNTTRFA